MSEDTLSSYLGSNVDAKSNGNRPKGLVVTISRQKGCGAFEISNLIIDKLNKLSYPDVKIPEWKLMSKEILEHSADQLKVAPSEVNTIIDMHEIQRLFLSFSSKSLPADATIKGTIREVIENAAKQGNVIIIGRGGVSITRNIENSVHIDLVAPYEWRVRRIATRDKVSIQEADKYVKDRDKQRESFKQYFLGTKQVDEHLYDLIINISTMKPDEVAEMIYNIVKSRQDALVHGH